MLTRLDRLKNAQHKLLIPFITAGYLPFDQTVEMMHGLVDSGADIIELGVPFSDPMADGKTIQEASQEALKRGTNLDDILNMVRLFREKNKKTPVILMGYANPIEHYGWDNFLPIAAKAGVDGLLTVDFPPEAAAEWQASFAKNKLSTVYLVAPTTTEDRMKMIVEAASGFIYFVSLKGVTGSSAINYDAISSQVDFLRNHTDLPIVAGFGIKDRQTAVAVAKYTDGIVIGSKIIEMIASSDNHSDPTAALAWLKDIRAALDEMEV